MAVHPDVKRVLVIGGGDGGVARELSHYQEIEVIDVVEPDKMFVDVCRKYFPDNACGLDDIRVRVYYEDGLRFLRGKEDEYDLIINDCTDPLGHAAGLFTKEFYGSCYKALHEDGIMVYLPAKNTTPSRTSTPSAGTSGGSRPGTTPPICTAAPLCCRAMWRTSSKKRRIDPSGR